MKIKMLYIRGFAFLLFLHPAMGGVALAQQQKETVDDYLNRAESYLPAHSDSAHMLARKAEFLANEHNLPVEKARCYYILGRIFFVEAAYNQSLENLLRAEAICAELPEPGLKAANFNMLGQVYYRIRQLDKSYLFHNQALSLFIELRDSTGMACTFGFLGHYFEKKQQYDSALYCQNKALEIYESNKNWNGKLLIMENLGCVYEDLGDYARAEQYFAGALELNNKYGTEEGGIPLYNNLGDVYYKTGRFALAHEMTEKAIKIARKYGDQYQERGALRDLSQLYAAEKHFEAAYYILDSSVTLYKKIYSDEGLKHLARLQAIFETERKNREIEILMRNKQINRMMLALVAGGFVLVLISGIAIVSRQRLKLQKNKELYSTRQKLMKLEIENKSKALSGRTLQIIEKNKLLKNLKEELNEISVQERKDARKEIKKTIRKIDQSFYHDKDWEDFKQIFEQIHQSFFDRLYDINPHLTQSELRLAALIKMRMSTKDVCAILSISQDSLRISRYRLRKKLFLNTGQKLVPFIQNVM